MYVLYVVMYTCTHLISYATVCINLVLFRGLAAFASGACHTACMYCMLYCTHLICYCIKSNVVIRVQFLPYFGKFLSLWALFLSLWAVSFVSQFLVFVDSFIVFVGSFLSFWRSPSHGAQPLGLSSSHQSSHRCAQARPAHPPPPKLAQ